MVLTGLKEKANNMFITVLVAKLVAGLLSTAEDEFLVPDGGYSRP